jgi:hypothetical protein
MKIIIFRNYDEGALYTPNAINPAAPEGAPPRRINDGNMQKTSCGAVPEKRPCSGGISQIISWIWCERDLFKSVSTEQIFG